jgi:UDP-2,3-diacylglucosamine pyrophosphatase LpxH
MTMHPADFLPDAALRLPPPSNSPARHFPVLFLSDLHLGSRACRDDLLLSFLQGHTADVIYLVGDIIDTWLPLGAHWSAAQHQILALLIDRARNGTRLIYTPGNHDAFFRRFIGQSMLGIEVVDRILHQAADGRRYLVVHGDEGDIFETRFPAISRLSCRIDNGMRGLVGWWNARRSTLGLPRSDLAERMVKRVNNLVRACDAFEARLSAVARCHGADGIICGHFHKPALHDDFGPAYANCGDWVENATALVETTSGRLRLIDWELHVAEIAAAAVQGQNLGLELNAAPVHMGFNKAAGPV